MTIRKYLAFGSGVGIEVRGADLEVAVTRVRPSGIQVLGRITIRGFRERPAAEWGAEYARFLNSVGASHLSATVLLPRREIIVRQLAFPGVSSKDMESAIALQLDTLHPYEDDVACGWSQTGNGAVLIGILRRTVLEQYISRFTEAGVAITSLTFSAAVMHAAVRLLSDPPAAGFLAVEATADGAVEIYGESPSRPVFSAELDVPVEKAVALAMAELRLGPEVAPAQLAQILPAPRANPVENDSSRNALPYATALAGACPRLAPSANLLPPEHRTSNSRTVFVPSFALAAVLLLVAGTLLAFSKLEDRLYLRKLEGEIAALDPQARKFAALDRQIDLARNRAKLLDEFRRRTRDDLDSLDELSRLVAPPAWTNAIEITRDSVNISGEAEQAATLLGILDASPLFLNSEFATITRLAGANDMFRIHTTREFRK